MCYSKIRIRPYKTSQPSEPSPSLGCKPDLGWASVFPLALSSCTPAEPYELLLPWVTSLGPWFLAHCPPPTSLSLLSHIPNPLLLWNPVVLTGKATVAGLWSHSLDCRQPWQCGNSSTEVYAFLLLLHKNSLNGRMSFFSSPAQVSL